VVIKMILVIKDTVVHLLITSIYVRLFKYILELTGILELISKETIIEVLL
jgi:hypothetical protein